VGVVLDCGGLDETIASGLAAVKPGGRVAWVGHGDEFVRLPLIAAQAKEVMFTGVFRYANVYPAAVGLLAAGKIDTAPLITHRFAFPQVPEAMAFALENKEIALKTMVNFE